MLIHLGLPPVARRLRGWHLACLFSWQKEVGVRTRLDWSGVVYSRVRLDRPVLRRALLRHRLEKLRRDESELRLERPAPLLDDGPDDARTGNPQRNWLHRKNKSASAANRRVRPSPRSLVDLKFEIMRNWGFKSHTAQDSPFRSIHFLQGWPKFPFPGLLRFVPAVA